MELHDLRLFQPLDPANSIARPDGREHADVRAGRLAASAGARCGRGKLLACAEISPMIPATQGA
jgi:hypothetical protein